MACSLGKNGVSSDKREGDGKTPTGSFSLRRGFIRTDKVNLKPSNFPPTFAMNETQQTFAWCDDPSSYDYNEFVELPFNASGMDSIGAVNSSRGSQVSQF